MLNTVLLMMIPLSTSLPHSASSSRTRAGLPSPYHESVILLEEVSGLVHHVSATSGDVTKLEFVDPSVFGRATHILNKVGKTGSGSAARMPKAEKTRYRMVRM